MSDETVVGVIPTAKIKTGFLSSKTYTLVFTDRRLILAEATKPLVKAEVERARAAAREHGGGFLAQLGAQLKTGWSFGSQYLGMDPAAILAETPGNTAINPSDVRSMTIEHRVRSSGEDGDIETDYLRITIETAAGKQTYNTEDEKPKAGEARGIAATAFGPVLR